MLESGKGPKRDREEGRSRETESKVDSSGSFQSVLGEGKRRSPLNALTGSY